MNAKSAEEQGQNGQMREVNVLDYVVVAAQHKKLIVRSVLGAVVITAVLLYLILPRWYKSTATILPPKQQSTLGLLSSLSKATAPLRSLGIGGGSDELSEFQTILLSRRTMVAVIDKFDLMEVYDLDTMEKTVIALAGNVSVGLGKEDVSLEISVLDTNPQRAADMANYFVETLDVIYRDLAVSEARANRLFLEKRYTQNVNDLKAAEDSFKVFQEKYGVYSVPDQVKGAVEAAAGIESRIAFKEVQLGVLSATTTKDNSLRQTAELELRELKKRLAGMKHGGKGDRSLVFAPFDKAPEIGIEYLRHYREIELQGRLLELLLPLYEQARIEEKRNTPSVSILDTAVPAVKPSKPKRMIIMIAVAMGSFLLAYLAALIMDYLDRMKGSRTQAEEEKISFVRKELKFKNLLR